MGSGIVRPDRKAFSRRVLIRIWRPKILGEHCQQLPVNRGENLFLLEAGRNYHPPVVHPAL